MHLECNIYLSVPDISLAEFEERLCIFEDLKALEAQLFALGDDEQQLFTDIKQVENFTRTNVKKYNKTCVVFSVLKKIGHWICFLMFLEEKAFREKRNRPYGKETHPTS
ncbi:unnamed protein product [Fraxinus pennsylvanica]|uniref:Uncharacterized protein n=1 Tax=Fraxinus pennsylvanica TaxID=56036 RepID=A0AAD1YLE2_9LAMI|nr:unnamed protein product [Fraxinus pennsylvanica]